MTDDKVPNTCPNCGHDVYCKRTAHKTPEGEIYLTENDKMEYFCKYCGWRYEEPKS